MRKYLLILLCALLVACDNGENFAPVTDLSMIEPIPKSGKHTVMAKETLYEIAWRYGEDYQTLAARNGIVPPYAIYVGEIIYLRGKKPQAVINKPVILPVSVKEPEFQMSTWVWPVKGQILNSFSANNKGINIAGTVGEAIYATGAGKVVYAGDGLRAYGNLIIIKHNHLYLSAYAHNSVILVKEGEWVKKGQKIAEMGKSGSNKAMLHFEIRRAGKPINPRTLLPLE